MFEHFVQDFSLNTTKRAWLEEEYSLESHDKDLKYFESLRFDKHLDEREKKYKLIQENKKPKPILPGWRLFAVIFVSRNRLASSLVNKIFASLLWEYAFILQNGFSKWISSHWIDETTENDRK